MGIWVTAVDHRHGTNLYVAASEDDKFAQLADYCRGSWHEIGEGEMARGTQPPPGMSDREVFTTYFEWQTEKGDEWFRSDELPWPDDDPVRVAAREVVEQFRKGGTAAAIAKLEAALHADD